MSESKKMLMVTDTAYDADGNAEYGVGELHDPGSLPEGVQYREVLATPAQIAGSSAHMKSKDAVAENADKLAEFQRLQGEESVVGPQEQAKAAGAKAAGSGTTPGTAKAGTKP